MEQTEHWNPDEVLTGEALKERIKERIDSVDFVQAKEDVLPFIADSRELDLWSKDFFCNITDRLVVIEQEQEELVQTQKPEPPKDGRGQFWIANSGKRHKLSCRHVRKNSGRYGTKSEGVRCLACNS